MKKILLHAFILISIASAITITVNAGTHSPQRIVKFHISREDSLPINNASLTIINNTTGEIWSEKNINAPFTVNGITTGNYTFRACDGPGDVSVEMDHYLASGGYVFRCYLVMNSQLKCR